MDEQPHSSVRVARSEDDGRARLMQRTADARARLVVRLLQQLTALARAPHCLSMLMVTRDGFLRQSRLMLEFSRRGGRLRCMNSGQRTVTGL